MIRIRVIDFEFDGEPPEGGVIEIGYCDLVAGSKDIAGSPYDWSVETGYSHLCNPGGPISPESMAVHHIEDDDVILEPDWRDAIRAFLSFGASDGVIAYAAHNAKAERQWIRPEWMGEKPAPFICTLKSAYRLWPDAPAFKNQVLRYWRRPAGLDREAASETHRAGSDAYVTAHLLRDMLNDEGASFEQLVEWSEKPALIPRCKFGDYRQTDGGRGALWSEVDEGLLRWILDKDFDEDLMFTAQFWLDKMMADRRIQQEQDELNRQLQENGLPVSTDSQSNPLVDERQGALDL